MAIPNFGPYVLPRDEKHTPAWHVYGNLAAAHEQRRGETRDLALAVGKFVPDPAVFSLGGDFLHWTSM